MFVLTRLGIHGPDIKRMCRDLSDVFDDWLLCGQRVRRRVGTTISMRCKLQRVQWRAFKLYFL